MCVQTHYIYKHTIQHLVASNEMLDVFVCVFVCVFVPTFSLTLSSISLLGDEMLDSVMCVCMCVQTYIFTDTIQHLVARRLCLYVCQ